VLEPLEHADVIGDELSALGTAGIIPSVGVGIHLPAMLRRMSITRGISGGPSGVFIRFSIGVDGLIRFAAELEGRNEGVIGVALEVGGPRWAEEDVADGMLTVNLRVGLLHA
jgi:hypothetical protein